MSYPHMSYIKYIIYYFIILAINKNYMFVLCLNGVRKKHLFCCMKTHNFLGFMYCVYNMLSCKYFKGADVIINFAICINFFNIPLTCFFVMSKIIN